MDKLDKDFTTKIEQWLINDHSSEEALREGATMVFQITRNTAMFNQLMIRPQRFGDKIEYELKKHLQYRLDGLTLDGVKKLDAEITPAIAAAVAAVASDQVDSDNVPSEHVENDGTTRIVSMGKRTDHEKLPVSIQAIWQENAERWNKIKKAYETCKSLDLSCDRYEYLNILKDNWYKYKKRMAEYDAAEIEFPDGKNNTENKDGVSDVIEPSALATQITNARSYISKNLPLFIDMVNQYSMHPEDKEDLGPKLRELNSKLRERAMLLISNNVNIGDELKVKLEHYEIIDTDSDE